MIHKIESKDAPRPTGPWSQGVMREGIICTSGQIALNAEGKFIDGSIEEQTHQVMKNLRAVIDAGGSSMMNVVKVTIYLTDMANYPKVNEVYATYFTDPYPARECVAVCGLPAGALVEMSMIAIKHLV